MLYRKSIRAIEVAGALMMMVGVPLLLLVDLLIGLMPDIAHHIF